MKQQKSAHSLYTFLILLPIWGIMALQAVVRIKAIKDDYTLFYCIFALLMLLLIGISIFIAGSYNKKHGRSGHAVSHIHLGLNPILAACFVTMCILMLYSDLIVFKKYYLISLIFLFLFGGLYVVWQRFDAEHRDKLMSVFILAIETGFLSASVFCFLFRPSANGIRYSGLSANPNVYGIFLITVWCCLITRLDYCISRSANITKALLISVEFGMAGFFLFMTGARTALVTVGFISLLWFIMRMIFSIKDGKPFLKYIVVSMLMFALSFIVSYFLLAKVPALINYPVEFERDRPFAAIDHDNNTVYAAEKTSDEPSITFADDGTDQTAVNLGQDMTGALETVEKEPSAFNRLFSALKEGDLDTLLNGRMDIYKGYIKKIDYKGHKNYGKKIKGLFGERYHYVVNAHNNVIQMAYSYGQFSAIPYILLCMIALIYAFRYYITFRDRSKIAAFPVMIIVSYTLSSMTELIFIPFQSLLAFCFWICLGELMITYGRKRS